MAKFVRNLDGDNDVNIQTLPVSGEGTAIVEGAVLIAGATADTNKGLAILAGANNALTEVVGVIQQAHTVATDSDNEGTIYTLQQVIVNPQGIFRFEYDSATTMAATQANTTTTFTLTSLEDNWEGGWLYVVSGTGIGELRFVTVGASGSCTLKTALTSGASDTYYKILPMFHRLCRTTANGKMGSAAAAGASIMRVVRNWVTYDGSKGFEELNPTIHDNVNLNGQNPRFFADCVFLSHAFNPMV